MDIGRSFSFVTEDEKWVTKILLGGVILLIPIVGQLAALGYVITVARNVARGVEKPLPEWGEFGDLLMRGLHYFVISLVYLLPYIIVSTLLSCVTSGIGASLSNSDSSSAGASSAIGGLVCLIVPISLILAIGGAILAYVGVARYVQADRLAAAFEFGEVVAMLRTYAGQWLMLLVVGIASGLVASLGIIACGVGILFTMFYAYCVQGHALGQTIRSIGGEVVVAPPAPPSPPTTTTF